MTQPLGAYVRTQAAVCAALNALLNPLAAWFGNRQAEFVPLAGAGGIVVDTAATSIILEFLVTVFTAANVRGALKKGRLAAEDGGVLLGEILARHRPEPGARSAAEHDRRDRSRAGNRGLRRAGGRKGGEVHGKSSLWFPAEGSWREGPRARDCEGGAPNGPPEPG